MKFNIYKKLTYKSFKSLYIALVFLCFILIFPGYAFSSDTLSLSGLNSPNVLIFLDTSGSMMWNEGVVWSGSGGTGYDQPETWADGGNSRVWAPGSNSAFSKIYNAKLAISVLVLNPPFSNFNLAFATFDQGQSESTGSCIYSNDESFQNPADAQYFGYSGTNANGTPDESGAYSVNSSLFSSHSCNSNENITTTQTIHTNTGTCSRNDRSCPNGGTCEISRHNRNGECVETTTTTTTDYFLSYNYPSYSNQGSWMVYVPSTTYDSSSGTGSLTTATIPPSSSSGSDYFLPESIAGPAINYVLWNAQDYGSSTDPAGNAVAGLKAAGDTPMSDSVSYNYEYFQNYINDADSNGAACQRNYEVIITDGEANDGGNYAAYSGVTGPDTINYGSSGRFGGGFSTISSSETPQVLYDIYNLSSSYPIETFVVGFGYSGTLGGYSYIQQMANAGAGIDPDSHFTGSSGTNNPLQFSATASSGSAMTLSLPSSAFSGDNGILIGDTVSDNGDQSSDCETINTGSNGEPSGTYANGSDCAVVTGITAPQNGASTGTVLLSNSLKNISAGSTGTVTVSGTVYLTFNYSQLENSLTNIFYQIESETASYTSPVIHEVSGSSGTDTYVYYANFKTLNQPLWGEGNIYLFKLDSSGNLEGPSGSAINPDGTIDTGNSYWSGGSGGMGAGGILADESASSRDVFTSTFDSTAGTETVMDLNPVSTTSGNSNIQNLLGLTSSNYSEVCPGATSESACAENILNFVLNPDSLTDNWKLGAIYNSDPVLIGAPDFAYSSSSYQTFKTDNDHRQQVLVAGANDGMLHGFDAGLYGSGPGSTSSTYGYGTGNELFGYIPPNFLDISGTSLDACVPSDSSITLPKITCWYESSITGTSMYEFVDSTPYVSDVFFNNAFDGTTNSTDNSTYQISTSSPSDSWHTVLVGGERNGGNYYYALDMTAPPDSSSSSSGYPVPLWNYTDSSMGNTWSEPIISYVCLQNPGWPTSGNSNTTGYGTCANNPNDSPTPNYLETYAAFFGGGYSSDNSTGDAVYALYVEPNPINSGSAASPDYSNNQLLWKFDSSDNSSMTYAIPSQISPVLSADFEMEGFYVGDLGGQMWAFNIPQDSEPYQNSNKQTNSNWTGCVLFKSNDSTASPLKIFLPPALSYDAQGNLWVYFGTGNMADLPEVITSRANEFIGINTAGAGGVGECATSAYSESDLTDSGNQADSNNTVVGMGSVSTPGWYITLAPGEKVVGNPVVYNDVVYFTTYTPPSDSNDACNENGTAKLYALYYLNGGGMISVDSSGTFSINSQATSSSGTVQSVVLGNGSIGGSGTGGNNGTGGGVPSSPVISNGNLIITTQSGGITQQKLVSIPTGITPNSWFIWR